MRLISMVITLFFLGGTGLALGSDLMLEEPPRTSFTGFGITFLLLTAVSGAYAAQAKSESETALAAANSSYAQYLAAGSDPDAQTTYKQQTKDDLAEAQSMEKKANTGYYLTLLFAVTSYYSFFPGHLPDNTILVTQNGLIIQHRF